jgi:hypothetical protein
MRWGVLIAAALLTACSGSGPSAPGNGSHEDAASNAATVSLDENSDDMNTAEIVPNDEGGTEADPGAKPQ